MKERDQNYKMAFPGSKRFDKQLEAAKKRLDWEKEEDAEKKWEKAIEAARSEVKKVLIARFTIARIASEACRINWGGGVHWEDGKENFYTIKRFAEAIGMNYKTLQNWVSTYKYAKTKLIEGTYSEDDYDRVRRVKAQLGRDRVGKDKRAVPKSKVQALFNKEKAKVPTSRRMWKFNRTLLNFKNFLKQKDLRIFEREDINDLKSGCRQILRYIEKEGG